MELEFGKGVVKDDNGEFVVQIQHSKNRESLFRSRSLFFRLVLDAVQCFSFFFYCSGKALVHPVPSSLAAYLSVWEDVLHPVLAQSVVTNKPSLVFPNATWSGPARLRNVLLPITNQFLGIAVAPHKLRYTALCSSCSLSCPLFCSMSLFCCFWFRHSQSINLLKTNPSLGQVNHSSWKCIVLSVSHKLESPVTAWWCLGRHSSSLWAIRL